MAEGGARLFARRLCLSSASCASRRWRRKKWIRETSSRYIATPLVSSLTYPRRLNVYTRPDEGEWLIKERAQRSEILACPSFTRIIREEVGGAGKWLIYRGDYAFLTQHTEPPRTLGARPFWQASSLQRIFESLSCSLYERKREYSKREWGLTFMKIDDAISPLWDTVLGLFYRNLWINLTFKLYREGRARARVWNKVKFWNIQLAFILSAAPRAAGEKGLFFFLLPERG